MFKGLIHWALKSDIICYNTENCGIMYRAHKNNPCLFPLLTPNLKFLKLTRHFRHICVVSSTTCAKNHITRLKHVDLTGASINTRSRMPLNLNCWKCVENATSEKKNNRAPQSHQPTHKKEKKPNHTVLYSSTSPHKAPYSYWRPIATPQLPHRQEFDC